ncbi:hypothetical protein EJ03DRAFT_212604 [Teratosphaeria nubilosa]|uniref:Lipid/polyisoprenoid-binding YceI-like domain-containing protein n=1 Tax=Teratosphaeria nubilosa TaxID=161662 RepID=A0A6G1LGK9_9PEZI|nr:hypothetical protein EJ03DRAFT_212604 [Teratosphaeria nubilosa]
MRLLTAFALLATCLVPARSQFIVGALALFEIVVEIIEAAEVVAEVSTSVEIAVTGDLGGGMIEVGASQTGAFGALEEEGSSAIARVADQVSGELDGFSIEQEGTSGVTTPFRLHLEPLEMSSGRLTNPITVEGPFTAELATNIRRGQPAGFEITKPAFGEGVEAYTKGRFGARVKSAKVNVLRAAS